MTDVDVPARPIEEPAQPDSIDRFGEHRQVFQHSIRVLIHLAITGASGFLFWLVAANRFPIADVGTASALISTVAFVTYLTTLGLPVTVARFGVGTHADDRAVFAWSVWLTSAASLLGAIGLVVLGSDQLLGPLRSLGPLVAISVVFVAVNSLSVATLADYRQFALGHHAIVLWRAGLFAVLRLAALMALPSDAGPLLVAVALLAPVTIALVATWIFDRSELPLRPHSPLRPHRERLGRFTVTNWLSLALIQAPFYVFPVIVLSAVTARENANFHIVWTMASMAFLVPQVTSRVLLTQAHDDDSRLRTQAWFSLKLTTLFAVAALVLTVALIPLLPVLYGGAYAGSADILPLLMLGLLPFAATSTTLTYVRVRERHRDTILVSAVLAGAILIPARAAVQASGAVGASAAWLLGHLVAGVAAIAVIDLGRNRSSREIGRPVGSATFILTLAAIGLPVLMLGPIGVAVGATVVVAHRLGLRPIIPALAVLLLAVAAASTLIEADLSVTMTYARDRPLAAAAAGLALAVLAAWSLLEMTDSCIGAAPVPPVRVRRLLRWPSGAPAVIAWAAVGALIGWAAQAELHGRSAALARILRSGAPIPERLGRARAGDIEWVGPILTAYGPLPAAVIGSLAGALALGSLAPTRRTHSPTAFWLTAIATVIAVGILARDPTHAVALASAVGAVRVLGRGSVPARRAMAAALLAFGALASFELVVVAIVLAMVMHARQRWGVRASLLLALPSVLVVAWWILDGASLDLSPLRHALDLDPIIVLALAVPILHSPTVGHRANSVPAPSVEPVMAPEAVPTAEAPARHFASAWPIRLALLACGVALTMINQPTRYIVDARFGHAFAPAHALAQLGSLWQSSGGLGRIAGTEQGPVPAFSYGALRLLGLSAPLAQHLWHGALLGVAAVGAASVLGHFRPKWGVAHLVTGLVYMLNPLSLGLFTNSSLFLATIVVAPWLQLSVLTAGSPGRRWWSPALFALCIAASLPTELPGTLYNVALLIPTAVYVVAVERQMTLRSLLGATVRAGALTLLCVGWVMARTLASRGDLGYRLALTEAPELVTTTTSFSETVRGMGSWLAYFRYGSIVPRPQFAALVESPWIVASSFVVPIVAGIYVWRSTWRPRLYFAVMAAVSATVIVGTYPTPRSPWGSIVSWLYDSVPAAEAMRNTQKAGGTFVLALAVLFGQATASAVAHRPVRWWRGAVVSATVIAIVGSSWHVWTLNLYPEVRQLDEVPQYWKSAAAWLNEAGNNGQARALVLPGSTSTTYRWGYVGDDIFEAYLTIPHLRVSTFPQSTSEAHNLLLALDQEATSPEVSTAAKVDILRRLGVRWVVLRNDLDWQAMSRPRPSAFDDWRHSPELQLVATFGEPGDNTTAPGDSSGDADAERLLPPVEVYEVPGWQPIVRLAPTVAPLVVSGDGEGWLELAAAGFVRGSRPLAYSAATTDAQLSSWLRAGGSVVVTDTNVLRQLTATATRLMATAALPSGSTGRGVTALFTAPDTRTTSWIDGVIRVTSSTPNTAQPWHRPANLLDGDIRTTWTTSPNSQPLGQWVEVELSSVQRPDLMEIVAADTAGAQVTEGSITTSDGRSFPFRFDDGQAVVALRGHPTTSLRLTVTGTQGFGAVSLADWSIAGLDLTELRNVPSDLARRSSWNGELLQALESAHVGYLFHREVGDGPQPVEIELRRRFEVIAPQEVTITGRVELLDDGRRPEALRAGTCGEVSIEVDGRTVPLRFDKSGTDPLKGTVRSCGQLSLEPGVHVIRHGADIAVDVLFLAPPGLSAEELEVPWPRAGTTVTAERMSGLDVTLEPSDTDRVLVSGRAARSGWSAATIDSGPDVDAVTLDVQSSFIVDQRSSRVRVWFAPQTPYDVAIALMYAGLAICAWILVRGPTGPRPHRTNRRADDP